MDIGLHRAGEREVILRNAKVAQIELALDLTGAKEESAPFTDEKDIPQTREKTERWYDRFVPDEVKLSELDIGRSSLRVEVDKGAMAFSGMKWHVEPGDSSGSYIATGTGGEILLPWSYIPPLRMQRADLRYQDSTVFLTNSDFRLYENGYLTLAGEASVIGGGFSFDGALEDVMAAEVLPENWVRKCSGELNSKVTIRGDQESKVVDGSLVLSNGVLTGLPILDSLGAYGGNPRFRRLALNEASLNYRWEDGRLTLSDIKLGSEGLMRVEGKLVVEEDEAIDGNFMIGLTPGTLASIPGAETKVFVPGPRGLLWTSLRITGTLDDPEEDLSNRLIAAAGMRMFEVIPETGERVMRYTSTAMTEDMARRITGEGGIIDQGTGILDSGKRIISGDANVVEEVEDVIRQGEGLVREVDDILGIFKGREPEPEKPKPEDSSHSVESDQPEPSPDGK